MGFPKIRATFGVSNYTTKQRMNSTTRLMPYELHVAKTIETLEEYIKVQQGKAVKTKSNEHRHFDFPC